MAGTARKAAPRKAAAVKTPPRPRVVLDLDNLSKAKAFPDLDLPNTPFTFLLNAVSYELRDPRDSDWKLALELSSNPFLLMRTALVGADDPIDAPTDFEMKCCRERHGLQPDPPDPDSDAGKQEAEDFPDGVTPAVIDRFTAADLPTWKLNALFEGWHAHYRIDLKDGQGILGALLGRK